MQCAAPWLARLAPADFVRARCLLHKHCRDDKTNNMGLMSGVMATHDQETYQFFRSTKVHCILCPREGGVEDSLLQGLARGNFCECNGCYCQNLHPETWHTSYALCVRWSPAMYSMVSCALRAWGDSIVGLLLQLPTMTPVECIGCRPLITTWTNPEP